LRSSHRGARGTRHGAKTGCVHEKWGSLQVAHPDELDAILREQDEFVPLDRRQFPGMNIEEECGQSLARWEKPDVQPSICDGGECLESHAHAFRHRAAVLFLHRTSHELSKNLPERMSQNTVAAVTEQRLTAVIDEREAP